MFIRPRRPKKNMHALKDNYSIHIYTREKLHEHSLYYK